MNIHKYVIHIYIYICTYVYIYIYICTTIQGLGVDLVDARPASDQERGDSNTSKRLQCPRMTPIPPKRLKNGKWLQALHRVQGLGIIDYYYQ